MAIERRYDAADGHIITDETTSSVRLDYAVDALRLCKRRPGLV